MLDLLITHATLPGFAAPTPRWACRTTASSPSRPAPCPSARETLADAAGCLEEPARRRALHMDATLSYGMPRVNQSGTLLEWHRAVGSAAALTAEAVIERAGLLRLPSRGLLAIRSHRGHQRRAPAGRGRAAGGCAGAAPHPGSLQLAAFPQDACCARRRRAYLSARWTAAWTWSAASPLRAHHGRWRRQRACCARSACARDKLRTCTATNPTTRCRATSRP